MKTLLSIIVLSVLTSCRSTSSNDIVLGIRCQEANVSMIVNDYSNWIGKKVEVDKDVTAVISFQFLELKKSEAIQVVDNALSRAGLKVIPVDSKTVRIVKKDKGI